MIIILLIVLILLAKSFKKFLLTSRQAKNLKKIVLLYWGNTGTRRTEHISPHFCGRFTGYRSFDGFCSNWRYWFTSASMDAHLPNPTWLMTAAWSAAAGLVLDRRCQRPNWRSHRPERLLAIWSFAVDAVDEPGAWQCGLWNSLYIPASIRDPSLTLAVFSNRLNTHLFEQ